MSSSARARPAVCWPTACPRTAVTRFAFSKAGPADKSAWIHLPIGYGKTMFHPIYNWGFYTDPDPNMLNRKLYWPRGRTLGGRCHRAPTRRRSGLAAC